MDRFEAPWLPLAEAAARLPATDGSLGTRHPWASSEVKKFITHTIRLNFKKLAEGRDWEVKTATYNSNGGVFEVTCAGFSSQDQVIAHPPSVPWTVGADESDQIFEDVRHRCWELLKRAFAENVLAHVSLISARLGSPLASISPIYPDQWHQLEIVDWQLGTGKFDNEERAYSIHGVEAAYLAKWKAMPTKTQNARVASEAEDRAIGSSRRWKFGFVMDTAWGLWPDGKLPRLGTEQIVAKIQQALPKDGVTISATTIKNAIREFKTSASTNSTES